MPKLWNETIAEHRHEVREAILEATWSLVAEHGLLSVTMSRIAQETGIGRATLYKYFSDVEAILSAWHERHVTGHLTDLAELKNQDGDAGDRLGAMALAYARICYFRDRHGAQELGALLHRGEHVAQAQQQLHNMFRDLLTEVTSSGGLRDDVPVEELASYCIHALTAAGSLPSEDAIPRLVAVTLDALGPRS